ncbi:hypothetical protein [Natronococcus occultus]|uniref:Uncharacterized protein n=1 Tax=Natronococcus occultus SP4 TaxID=694430 RepID=L0K0S9_9EURY|nr:hypothetical protein [Natronococcus occultus]AGB38611.1 hypothetical protein Natoc_2853 [Natronococcus occultus SP4]
MFRTLPSRLRRGTDTGDTEDESEDDGSFTPSRLDASVLQAHGASVGPETDADADELEERAREVERGHEK